MPESAQPTKPPDSRSLRDRIRVKVVSARFPRAGVRYEGFLSQPLPFGRVLHLARGRGFVSVSLGRKTPTYPDMPQYQHRGLLVRWEATGNGGTSGRYEEFWRSQSEVPRD